MAFAAGFPDLVADHDQTGIFLGWPAGLIRWRGYPDMMFCYA